MPRFGSVRWRRILACAARAAGGIPQGWRLPAAVLVVSALVISAAAALVSATPASAQSTYPPPDLFNLSALELSATQNGQPYPAGIYSATPAQIASLQDLEQTAISNTISLHGLAADDADAVQTWGRDDADAELWALLVQAIQTPAAQQTTDQSNAVAWLTAVLQRQDVLAADNAGLEYTKWAGLGISAYNSLLASSPTQSQLQNFLEGTPVPYTDGGSDQNPSASTDGGYCVYQPPAPDQSQYTGNIYTSFLDSTAPETCFGPCAEVFGCPDPTPSYDNFVAWGAADADDTLFDTADFASEDQSIAESGALIGAALTAPGIGAGVAAAGPGAALLGSTYQLLLLPRAAGAAWQNIVADYDSKVASGVDEDTAWTEAAGDMADEAADITSISVGSIVGVVLLAIAVAVQVGLQVSQAADLPGQLASFIAQAPSAVPDLASMVGNSSQMQGLFGLFVGSTLPAATQTSCDNSTLVGPAGQPLTPCLNAPDPPAASASDPQWLVTPQGSAQTSESTLSYNDAGSGETFDTYLSGNWFVSTLTSPDGQQATIQSLRLQYSDWQGDEMTAWLFDSGTTPMFLTAADSEFGPNFDPSTCISDGTCSWTPAIQVVGSDGTDLSVSVSPGTEPDSAPTPPALPPTLPLCSSDPSLSPPNCATIQSLATPIDLAASPGAPQPGQHVTYTATLAAAVTGGTVSFSNGISNVCSNVPLTEIFITTTSTVNGVTITTSSLAYQATCSTTYQQTGPQYMFATFSGSPDTLWAPAQASLIVDVGNLAATTTTVAAQNSGPVTPGQVESYTATVESAGPAPTGTVTFSVGSSTICADVPVTNGQATCSISIESAGPAYVTAAYSGDSGTQPSQGQLLVDAQLGTITTVSASTTSTEVGQPVTYTATVTEQTGSAPAATAGGSVTFASGSTTLCSDVPVQATTSASSFTATCTYDYAAGGAQNVTASYGGDSFTTASSGSTSVTVELAPTYTSVYAAPSNPLDLQPEVGAPVTYTAIVNTAANVTPTGTVTFTSGSTTLCSDVPLSGPIPYTATCTQTYSAAGQQSVTAAYSGDSGTAASSGQTTVTIGPAEALLGLSASDPSPVYGQPVTFGASVLPVYPSTGGVPPTGTVTFSVDGQQLGQPVTVGAGNSAISAAVSDLAPGTHTVTASYSGDANYTSAASAKLTVNVGQAATTTGLTASDTTPVVGEPVTVQASVAPASPSTGGVPPTGTVTFSVDGQQVGQPVQVGANGTATSPALPELAPGTHTVTASYSGDANYTGSASSNLTITVGQAATTTGIIASDTSPVTGEPVTVQATVAPASPSTAGPSPTGTVTFSLNGQQVGQPVQVGANGTATSPALPDLAPGTYTVTASYSGDANYAGSASSNLTITVGQAATTTELVASSGAPLFGQPVTFTGTPFPVSPSTDGPVATGTVTFSLDGQQLGSPVQVSPDGTATSTVVYGLAPGVHTVTATYSGDGNYTGSTSSTLTVTVGCSQTISGTEYGAVEVTGSTCATSGSSIHGAVTVESGGALALTGATVDGAINATGATAVLICGSTVHGAVTITDSTGPVQLGGPAGSSCAPDSINGPVTINDTAGSVTIDGASLAGQVTIEDSSGAVTVTGLTLQGPLSITGNTGGVTAGTNQVTGPVTVSDNTGTAPVTVSANTVSGPLACSGDTPAPGDSGTVNTATGSGSGQCADLTVS